MTSPNASHLVQAFFRRLVLVAAALAPLVPTALPVLLAGAAPTAVQAREGGERKSRYDRQDEGRGRGERPEQGGDGSRRESGAGFEPARRAAEPDYSRRSGRLSPEERRELRREIHDLGRDVYRRNR